MSLANIQNVAPNTSLEAEACVLGCMIGDPGCAELGAASLKEKDFFSLPHALIFRHAAKLVAEGSSPDLVVLMQRLRDHGDLDKVGGADYVVQIMQTPPSYRNLSHYVKIVKDMHFLRSLDALSVTIQKIVSNQDMPPDQKRIEVGAATDAVLSENSRSLKSCNTLIEDFLSNLEDLNATRGLRLGYPQLDRYGETLPGTLTICAARPSIGKTSVAVGAMLEIAKNGHRVLLHSLEMTAEEILSRCICFLAGISTEELEMGRDMFPPDEWPSVKKRIIDATDQINKLPIIIDDQAGRTVQDIRAACSKHKPDIVIVDYLGLMHHRDDDRDDLRIGSTVQGLKETAKKFNIPVLLLAQLNRDSERREGKTPTLADLRGSGQIEEHADRVILLHRDKHPDVDVDYGKFIVAKNRNGRTGVIEVGFVLKTMRWMEIKK